ncbi:hypothetical protein ACTI_61010 [Actinoplanes sp. OR16]|nr:hypothetical protein ACTI_61010 [Actinoplanes sp. OR16]
MFFALTREQDDALVATADDDEVRDFVESVEEQWDDAWLCEVDKSWDALHRCLGDGTLRCGYGRHGGGPLETAVLGGGHHYEGADYVVAHVPAADVPAVATALQGVDEGWLRDRHQRVGQGGMEDFDYLWHYFREVRDFYGRAAAAGRSVIFTVDQ